MGCQKTLTIQPDQGDMPLSEAVYVASVNKIFATHGPYLHRLNATTGVKDASLLMAGLPTNSCLCYDNVANLLYWSGWIDPAQALGWNGASPFYTASDKMVPWIVNPVTFTKSGRFKSVDPAVDSTPLGLQNQNSDCGFKRMWFFDNMLFYNMDYGGVITMRKPFTGAGPYQYYPQNFPLLGAGLNNGDGMCDMCWDSFRSCLWLCSKTTPFVWQGVIGGYWADPTAYGFGLDYHMEGVPNIPYGNPHPVGLTYSISNDRLYICTGSQLIYKMNPVGGAHNNPDVTILSLGRVDAGPIRIRYRDLDSKVYVPCMYDNTVCVIDPGAADAVTVKTDFDVPIDVVFTPTKAFAVQLGALGLKEIV